jgi:hypothetical protein
MKAKQLLLIAATTLCLSGIVSTAFAQDDGDDGHVFAVSTYQWPFDNLEDIFALMEETQSLVDENEYMLSRKVLTHEWAGDFSVMMIVEYASLADISNAQERGTELFNAKYPDEAEREARGEQFGALTGTSMHVDNILRGNPALAK